MTVKRWCVSGKLPAIAKPYGEKTSWLISPQALDLITERETAAPESRKAEAKSIKPHVDYQKAWINAISKGTLNGKVYSPRTIDDYSHYIELYCSKHLMVTFDNLRRDLNAIPVAHFAKREHYYKAVLCFSRFLILENVLEKSFIEVIKPLYPKRHLPPKRQAVDESGIQSLLAVCETLQDRLIITLLAHTGLRASEACALLWNDVDFEKGCLIVKLGKGNKTRRMGITTVLLNAFKAHREDTLKKSTGHVFTNRDGHPMNRNGLYQRLERLGIKAKVKVSPHALRRAFVTINANKGRPLPILQRSCGHSDVRTTMSYCMTSEQEVIEAMKGWD